MTQASTADAGGAPSPYRHLIELILFTTYAAFGLSWIALTPLSAEVQRAFRIGTAEFGLINTSVSAAKVVAPLLTGWLATRLGVRRTILAGSVLISAAILAPFAERFDAFLASRFVFGVGGAVVVTLLGPMVMTWYGKGELPIVTAVNSVAVNSGITLTYYATPVLAAALGGFRPVLKAYAALNVLLALAWALLGRDGPLGTTAPAGAGATPERARYADVWRRRETWIIAIGFSGPLALYLCFNTLLPRYYMEAFGMSKAAAAGYTGLFNLVGIPTAIVAGLLTRRLGLRRPFIIGAGVLMAASAFGMFLSANPAVLLPCAVLLGVALFAYVGPLFTVPLELPGVTAPQVSLMMGTVFSVAYLFSSLSPIITGALRDARGSFVPGFSLWAGYSAVLSLCGLLLPETGPRGRAPAAR